MKSKSQKASDENTIIKEATAYSGVQYFSQFILGIRGFIIAKFLGPSLYGVWTMFKTLIATTKYSSLGTSYAMTRDVPYNIGTNKSENNVILQKNVLSMRVMISTIACLILFILSFTKKYKGYQVEIVILGMVYIIQNIYNYIQEKLKSETKIITLSKYDLAFAILNTLFGISLLFFLRISGLLFGMFLSYVVLLIAAMKKEEIALSFGFQKSSLFSLIKTGMPIMMIYVSFYLMNNIDKIFVFAFLGSTLTGYYGLASFISAIVNYIPATITTVLFPRMMQKLGRTKSRKAIEEYFSKPIFIISLLMPVILGIFYILIDLPIIYLLPKYIPAIDAIRVLILTLFFPSILFIPINILIAFNKQKMYMIISFFLILFQAALQYHGIKLGYGITGVAAATGISFFAASLLSNMMVMRLFKRSAADMAMHSLKTYLPFVYSIFGLYISYILTAGISGILLKGLSSTLIFIILMMPFLIYLNNKTRIANKVIASFLLK